MLWIKAFHIIFMVTWFSGLFYLPRLFVYHAEAQDRIGIERFKIMEQRLYYMITTPGAFLTIFFGIWLILYNPSEFLQIHWFQIKLGLVALLVIYHVYLGKLLHDFKHDRNQHRQLFFRVLNELPTVGLVAIVLLAIVKPEF